MVESISTECAYTAPWSSSSPPPAFIPLTPKSTNPFNFNLNLNHQIESESESYPYPSGKALTENTTTIQTRPTSPVTSSSKNVNPSPPSTLPLHLYKDLPTHLLQPDGTPDYLRMILSADIYSLVKTTPLTPATNLSAKLGCEVLLKREDLQPVFSFKLRGAFNMMRQLEGEQKWKGVVACSAGNHAQGVALSGLHLSIPCTIVMPMGTPKIKYENVARLGAKVVLHGQDFDEAKTECSRLALAYGLTIIPPFDEPRVIAGQGTVGVEICRQTDMSKVDVVFACVGGGGLLAGMAAYIKRIAPPHVKVIGVETFDGDALARSLQADRRVTLDEVGLFADGTAVKTVGEECFRICRDLVDGVVRVGTDEICAAIRDTFEDTRSIPEPSGALALAGLKRYVAEHNLRDSGKRFVAVVSGANMNFSRLRFVAERADLGDRNEVLLCVEIPEKEGSFLKLHNHIHPRAITEFSYRYRSNEKAFIYLSFLLGSSPSPSTATPSANETPKTNGSLKAPSAGPASTSTSQSQPIPPPTSSETPPPPVAPHRSDELDHLLQNLEKDGMPAMDISDNEFAKSHARYLVGGRAEVTDERVFRFEFPERPGALRKFLQGLHAGWNISLFHYRNQGSDVGRVLAGIQVERTEKAQQGFQKWLDHELGYPYVEETKNAVYERFLR